VSQFRKTCEHARHAQDPMGFAEAERQAHEDRYLKLSPQEDGALVLRWQVVRTKGERWKAIPPLPPRWYSDPDPPPD